RGGKKRAGHPRGRRGARQPLEQAASTQGGGGCRGVRSGEAAVTLGNHQAYSAVGREDVPACPGSGIRSGGPAARRYPATAQATGQRLKESGDFALFQ